MPTVFTNDVQCRSIGKNVELEFDWDEANVSHLARHKISQAEVEQLFLNNALIREYEAVDAEDRWSAAGITGSFRILVVIFTVRNERIRPITGWDADRRTKNEFFSERGT